MGELVAMVFGSPSQPLFDKYGPLWDKYGYLPRDVVEAYPTDAAHKDTRCNYIEGEIANMKSHPQLLDTPDDPERSRSIRVMRRMYKTTGCGAPNTGCAHQ